MAKKTFNVSMDEELVKKIDAAAKKQYTSRSDFLRMAALKALNENSAADNQALEAAQNILRKHKKDFKNLAER
ncbi:MAG: ribbon-helix-helix domain-containing protein [Candidatus Saccharibacteria bacterium]|nr:ribbon-helix-helix domain-containing protein [Candidatus Saccharibacteria bacterium]